MLWRTGLLAVALSAAAFGVSAQSRPDRLLISEPVQGYAYYNRPGATVEQHDAEFRDCLVATNVQRNGVGGSVAHQWVWGGVIQAIGTSAIENCMIASGWRVFQLPAAEGRTIARLADADFKARFAGMVGAPTPPGVLARTWDNQASRPARYHTPSRPRAQSGDQLSARSFRLSGLEVHLRTPEEASGPTYTNVRGVPLDRIVAPAPGKAIVVVGGFGNRWIGFARTADTGGEIAFGLRSSRRGLWHAFEVPAGRYRIVGTGWVNHCLGSPAFEITAGDVVYAGRFLLEGETLGPTLDVSEVPAQLDGTLRDRLRPAQYNNGSTTLCPFGVGIYPLEIPGVPFQEGYRGGSLAVVTAPSPD
ncbi:hypothetical protein [Brevundimonas sp. A19_0]|uniref:hypothetical protein n=1 Tax=Brevundimonas sp. A19_0 TaxID=2821087 RepID=UPI001ADC5BD2|nr:hypothetical protein [Brevundimonas sp. A19_0]MBO9501346.1 hypothetical protein [Brevundimonas sp. A19_0]